METSRTRLGEMVRARRKQFRPRLSQAAAAARAGISDTTWLKVEHGEAVSDDTYAVVEDVIRWEAGSAQAVLDGGGPTELALGGDDEADLRQLVDELRSKLDDALARLDETESRVDRLEEAVSGTRPAEPSYDERSLQIRDERLRLSAERAEQAAQRAARPEPPRRRDRAG